jgi:hypothetical protein
MKFDEILLGYIVNVFVLMVSFVSIAFNVLFLYLDAQPLIYVIMSPILCLLRFLLSPQTKFGDSLFLHRFLLLLNPQTKFGDLLFLHRFLLHHPDCCRVMYCYSTFLFHYYSYYSSTHFCPLDFLEMPWSNFMKLCRNIICHVKLCVKGLIFSKWLPLPWKRPKC